MAYFKGLPKYFNRIEQLRQSGDYLKYPNFGEMGLAEIGISVRYNKAQFESLNTGRPLVIIGNHHLGIADGLALQYISSQARREKPSLLFLARWIEKLLPHAVFGDEQGWGTAIPVDINQPKPTDPLYDSKMAEIKAFNSTWSRTSLKTLRSGGALIIFPAGHVAAINEGGEKYPSNVYDAPNSWQEGFLSLARLGKADIVFANVKSVNSESFYKNRKRFGGGDLERVIWFFSEALAKKGQEIDVELSKPMSLDEIYDKLAEVYGSTRETLEADPALTAELMRQYTYQLSVFSPQALDTKDAPQRR
jgi:1-acyl-sn-glycerol-3-phosphate acyltransferase